MRITCQTETIDTDPGFDFTRDLISVEYGTDDHASIDRWNCGFVAIEQMGFDG